MNLNVAQLGVLIPLLAIFMGLSLAIVTVFTRHRSRIAALEQRHRERMAAIEKGVELPPELSPDTEAESDAGRVRKPAARYLLQGLVCLGIGAALLVSTISVMPEELLLPGSILVAIGAAFVIYYFIAGRNETPPPA
jgi:VIT1/CCC1 family predicted Fe2+/Mn2+ transporter